MEWKKQDTNFTLTVMVERLVSGPVERKADPSADGWVETTVAKSAEQLVERKVLWWAAPLDVGKVASTAEQMEP